MARHRTFILLSIALAVAGVALYFATPHWEGWENVIHIVGKGDNMPIAGLIPIIAFFTYLSMSEALRHDRLIADGRGDEVLDEMYK